MIRGASICLDDDTFKKACIMSVFTAGNPVFWNINLT